MIKLYSSHYPGELELEPILKFRLTYDGPLYASQPNKQWCTYEDCPLDQKKALKISTHKQDLRKHFHKQIKQLWATNPALKGMMVSSAAGPTYRPISDARAYFGGEPDIHMIEYISRDFEEHGYKYCPLVMEEFSVLCSLDILFLRREAPGDTLSGGDVDNRIKTLIDGLRKPSSRKELGDHIAPGEGENPLHVLLQDDSLVTGFSVETDTLFDAPKLTKKGKVSDDDKNLARVVITVTLRPYIPNFFNLSFI